MTQNHPKFQPQPPNESALGAQNSEPPAIQMVSFVYNSRGGHGGGGECTEGYSIQKSTVCNGKGS